MSDNENQYVIRLGNHWLDTDDLQEIISWETDLCKASLHSLAWCQNFVQKQAEKSQKCFIHPFNDALHAVRWQQKLVHKNKWLYRFEHYVRENYGNKISETGIWINGHMYYGTRMSISEAVKAIGKAFKLEPQI